MWRQWNLYRVQPNGSLVRRYDLKRPYDGKLESQIEHFTATYPGCIIENHGNGVVKIEIPNDGLHLLKREEPCLDADKDVWYHSWPAENTIESYGRFGSNEAGTAEEIAFDLETIPGKVEYVVEILSPNHVIAKFADGVSTPINIRRGFIKMRSYRYLTLDWSTVSDDGNFVSPTSMDVHLQGILRLGDYRKPFISESPIRFVNGRTVVLKNGDTHELIGIDPKFRRWLKANMPDWNWRTPITNCQNWLDI